MCNPWNDPDRTFVFHKGRVALYAILKAAGIGSGDEVAVPGFTCVVVPAAVLYTGAAVRFYDLKRESLEPDLHHLNSRVTPRTRAIILQHTFGYPAIATEDIRALQSRGILVIEDCAHAIGSTLDGQQCGTLGDAGFMSFQWSKPLPAALGGVARIEGADLLDNMRQLHQQTPIVDSATELKLEGLRLAHKALYRPRIAHLARNAYRALGSRGIVPGSSSVHELERPQMPSHYLLRPSERREKLLRELLSTSDQAANDRRNRAQAWQERLAGSSLSTIRPWTHDSNLPSRSDAVPLRIPLQSPRRDELLSSAERRGVELGDWFLSPLHPLLDSLERFGYTVGECPSAESLCRGMFNVMTHPRVTQADMDRTIRFLEDFGKSADTRGSHLP
jgi:dTDP-4-amino-4,6-dideoxygalactose transaminase